MVIESKDNNKLLLCMSVDADVQDCMAIINTMKSSNVNFTVLLLCSNSYSLLIEEKLKSLEVEVEKIMLPESITSFLLDPWSKILNRYFIMNDFEFIHAVGFKAMMVGCLLKTRFHVPLVSNLLGPAGGRLRLWLLKRMLILFHDHFIVNDVSLVEALGRSPVWREKKIESDLILPKEVLAQYFPAKVKVKKKAS